MGLVRRANSRRGDDTTTTDDDDDDAVDGVDDGSLGVVMFVFCVLGATCISTRPKERIDCDLMKRLCVTRYHDVNVLIECRLGKKSTTQYLPIPEVNFDYFSCIVVLL
jgi:hypothetical protein